MKSSDKKNSCHPGPVDVSDAKGQAPRRKTSSLPKSVPAKTGHKPQTPDTEYPRSRADRHALERAENEGMYLRAG
jgi:hypothetical protein